jgi:exoribonuclease R
MESYKILIHDRICSNWEILDNTYHQKKELKIDDPIKYKLFSNDVFEFNNNTVNILHSSVRISGDIPGVLILKGNKTYGRKKNKLLYKCIPDDIRLPPFLVPYEIKNVGFSKNFINLYVTFHFNDWEYKHPHGVLSKVIGTVDILDNFYEYQLYCKSLNASIQKFQKATSKALQQNSHDAFIESIKLKFPSLEERYKEDYHIIAIDPENSLDFDDAVSIQRIDENTQKLTIYISNVTIWMDVLNLWDTFSRRISTIYLPDKKRPMLPTILSDCLCSLQEKVTRIAFYMDLIIINNKITDISYGNALIRVDKNYHYEDPKLINNKSYIDILNLTKQLNKDHKFINNINNSHDVISYLMVLMNCFTAKQFISYNSGIFRSTIMKNPIQIPDSVPEEISKFIKIWKSSSGQYIDVSTVKNCEEYRHNLLNIDAYIHITSPIRRLVDILNIIKFQEVKGIITLSENATRFYKKWINDLDYINITMRSIRKIQCDCNLLDLCQNSPEVMEKEYSGYIFDRIQRNDGLFQFNVFLPDLRLSARITTRDEFDNFTTHIFKLFLFVDEENFRKKIRLHKI